MKERLSIKLCTDLRCWAQQVSSQSITLVVYRPCTVVALPGGACRECVGLTNNKLRSTRLFNRVVRAATFEVYRASRSVKILVASAAETGVHELEVRYAGLLHSVDTKCLWISAFARLRVSAAVLLSFILATVPSAPAYRPRRSAAVHVVAGSCRRMRYAKTHAYSDLSARSIISDGQHQS